MIKQLHILRNLKDYCLHWVEKISGNIHAWAWNKRFKERDPEEWIKGYREWKKK